MNRIYEMGSESDTAHCYQRLGYIGGFTFFWLSDEYKFEYSENITFTT